MDIDAVRPAVADDALAAGGQLDGLGAIVMLEAIVQRMPLPGDPGRVGAAIEQEAALAAVGPERIVLAADDLGGAVSVQIDDTERMGAAHDIDKVHGPWALARIGRILEPGDARNRRDSL